MLCWDRGVLSSSPTFAYIKAHVLHYFQQRGANSSFRCESQCGTNGLTHVTWAQDCGGVMGSNLSSMGSKLSWFIVKCQGE